MSINSVTIDGRLGADPEVKELADGKCVVNVRFCHGERKLNQETGEWVEVPNWFRGVAWNGLGRILAKAKKGDRIVVGGRLGERSWATDNGEKRSITEIRIDGIFGEFEFNPRQEAGRPSAPAAERPQRGSGGGSRVPVPAKSFVPEDDDIPF